MFFGDKILDLETDFRKFGSVATLRSLIKILRASLMQIGKEMAEKYAKQQPAARGKFALEDLPHDVSALICLPGLVTLIFDLLTLKLVCESHQRWGTFIPNLGTLSLRVLEVFAMYARNGRTYIQTDGQKQRLSSPSLRAGQIASLHVPI